MGEVSSDIRPNRKKAMIYFENDDYKYLPAAYAAETHRCTVEQTMSFIGQTNFRQGRHGNQSTLERLKKPGNKCTRKWPDQDFEDQCMSDASNCSVCPLPVPVTIEIS